MTHVDLGPYTLEADLDPQTGLAKWPLSFKRIQKDVKLPKVEQKPVARPEQPPRAC